jgi:hypothetical protein
MSSEEVARVQAHLVGAERIARSRSVTTLSRSVRRVRGLLLAELRRYRRAGRFPKNVDFPNRRMPYFIDAEGTRCAIAHLMELTGQRALVLEIARTTNNALVEELAEDARLCAWLAAVGLTAAEAARIQPTYEERNMHPTRATIYCRKIEAKTIASGTVVSENRLRVDAVAPHRWASCADVAVGAEVPIAHGAVGTTRVVVLEHDTNAVCAGHSIPQYEMNPEAVAQLGDMSPSECARTAEDRYECGVLHGCGRCATAPAGGDDVAALTAISLAALLGVRRARRPMR